MNIIKFILTRKGVQIMESKLNVQKPAGCIDVNGKRIDVKKLVSHIQRGYIGSTIAVVIYGDKRRYSVYKDYRENVVGSLYVTDENNKYYQLPCADYNSLDVSPAVKAIIKNVSENRAVLDNIKGVIWDTIPKKANGIHITAKYTFNEEYLPPRARKPRLRNVEKTMNVTIREATEQNAPVAMITTTYKSSYGESDWRETTYRWHNGKLYTPCLIQHGVDYKEQRSIREMGHMLNETNHSYAAENENDKIAKVRENASRFLIIDDVLHEESGEPRYNITTFGLGNNHGGTGFFIENSYNPNIREDFYFNALQRAEAIERFKQVALGRGDTESVKKEVRENIQVLIPESVKLKPTKTQSQPTAKPAESPKFTAVSRLLNQQKKLVGLVLSDGKQQRECTLKQCITLAQKGEIKHVKAVTRDKSTYLAGNGISLEGLPCTVV
jgi:hypothetical protein